MKQLLALLLLLLLIGCADEPMYKVECYHNARLDTIWVVEKRTTSHTFISDIFWYEEIARFQTKREADSLFKIKSTEYEEWEKSQYR